MASLVYAAEMFYFITKYEYNESEDMSSCWEMVTKPDI